MMSCEEEIEGAQTDGGGAACGLDEAEEASLAAMAKALGHPVRVRIVRILAQRRACVCGELVDALPLAQSTVSQHLKILKEAGLILGQIDGPRVCYCLSPEAIERLHALIGALRGAQNRGGC